MTLSFEVKSKLGVPDAGNDSIHFDPISANRMTFVKF